MNIKQLTEELDRIFESDKVMIGGFELIPHGEKAVKQTVRQIVVIIMI